MKTILITNNPDIAAIAQKCGVTRIMVDLESMGKKERQASRNTFISSHTQDDIVRIKAILTTSKLIVRINPWGAHSAGEIETALAGGADIIMLPMITDLAQLDHFIKAINGRAQPLPLVETEYSMNQMQAIAANPAIPEIYIGLNDLHLSLGLTFLFEPLAMGLLDRMASTIKAAKKTFGFGGIAAMGSGELPAQRILGEHIRLGSDCVILSSKFCKDIDTNNPEGLEERFQNAMNAMAKATKELRQRSPKEQEMDKEETAAIIRELAIKLRK